MKYSVYVSPSLDGILTHESLMYEGIRQPTEILRACDGGSRSKDPGKRLQEEKVLEQYFYDLYSVFIKKLSSFALAGVYDNAESVKIQAMLQEIMKVKKLIARGSK